MERPMFCLVINRIICSYCIVIIIICIIRSWCFVCLINSSEVIKTYSMNKTSYWYIFVFHPLICRIIYGYIFLLRIVNVKTFQLVAIINSIIQYCLISCIISFLLIFYMCIKFFFIKSFAILLCFFYCFLSCFIYFLCFF